MSINYSTLASMMGAITSVRPDNTMDMVTPSVLNTNWDLIIKSIDKLTLENLSNYKLFLEKLEAALEKRGATDTDTDIINELTANIKTLKEQINKLIAEKAELTEDVTELTEVQQQLENLNKEVNTELTNALTEVKTLTKEIDNKDVTINFLNNSLEDVINTYNNVLKKLCEEVSITNATDATKDYIITDAVLEGKTTITGNTILLENANTSGNSLIVNANNININGLNVSGNYLKSNGNCIGSIYSDGYITIKDCTISPDSAYNGLEIGLSKGEAKSILIENVTFAGNFTNNAILVFGTADNCVITVKNCTFESVSNMIRLSNRTNVHCVLNIINCTCNKWDTSSPWFGALICQDYTSGTKEKEESNNLFAPDKITINVENLIKPDGTKLEAPSDISTICGTNDTNQIFYVWNSKGKLIAYDANRYPTINIK